ncbi:hypothetical protein, conserved, DUF257 family [Thermococcus kodakarensis KOD1]|uniref:KaiC-like domain-containing protein n=1 Tax=Thermococcus kodakarensis (strain ATCC BAA-918 / JCM 12380 / KOD1) TaxID=69014 RepID=Q5JIQ6_THEKO|nr:DUF257 domain-containing protein [Thermococcus kodakarensis]WCN27546.1 DUF257 domain-containing protein [Thermococcus kodakarensis]WCN29837.1 DUF257 domain-containing protein [Thermococcus kodakarensis]BAD85798.1 hypothetical protein, conserved, DUF257 family [Thermococcus kodakarensis KOD1]
MENETRTHDYSRIPFFQGKNLKPGSLVLIENISSPGAKLSFYALLKVSKEKGIPLIVEDIFDTLPIYVKHIELMGFHVPSESINVIKVAGIDSVGNVVEKLSFEADPNFYIPKKERAVSKIVGDNTPHILLILGLERLLMFQRNLRDLYPIVRYFRENLNSPNRATISIIETPVLNSIKPNPLPMLESVASSVIELYMENEALIVRPKKALSLFTVNAERFKVSLGDIVEVLREW